MKMRKILSVLLFLIIQFSALGQLSSPTDSAFESLTKLDNDSGKVKNVLRFSLKTNREGQSEKAIKFAAYALQIARQINFQSGVSKSLRVIASTYDDIGLNDQALLYYDSALTVAKKINDVKEIVTILNGFGVVSFKTGQNTKAIEQFNEGLRIAEQSEFAEGIAVIYGSLSRLYLNAKQYQTSVFYLNKYLHYSITSKNKSYQSSAYHNLGATYYEASVYDSAIYYLRKSVAIKEEINDSAQLATLFLDLAGAFLETGKRDSAYFLINEAILISNALGNEVTLARSYLTYGQFLGEEKKYRNAIGYLQLSLPIFEQYSLLPEKKIAVSTLVQWYDSISDYKNELKYFKELKILDDTLSTELLESKLNAAKIEKDYKILQLKNVIQEEEATNQKKSRNYAYSISLLILIVAITLMSRQKVKRNNAVLKKSNDLRQRISNDLHDDIGSRLSIISMIAVQGKSLLSDTQSSVSPLFDNIISESSLLDENLHDVVNATNPQKNYVSILISELRSHAYKILDVASIKLKLNIPEVDTDIKINPDVSYNLLKMFKELFTNCIKHSQANLITIEFIVDKNKNYKLSFADNGKGFDFKNLSTNRNGLKKIQKRAQDINAKCAIESSAGLGTSVIITGSLNG